MFTVIGMEERVTAFGLVELMKQVLVVQFQPTISLTHNSTPTLIARVLLVDELPKYHKFSPSEVVEWVREQDALITLPQSRAAAAKVELQEREGTPTQLLALLCPFIHAFNSGSEGAAVVGETVVGAAVVGVTVVGAVVVGVTVVGALVVGAVVVGETVVGAVVGALVVGAVVVGELQVQDDGLVSVGVVKELENMHT